MYYKVVSVFGEKMFSYNTHLRGPDENDVEYKEGVKTLPKIPNSKLYIFKDLTLAEEFMECGSITNEIWECEVENPEPSNLILSVWERLPLEYFWNNINSGNYKMDDDPHRIFMQNTMVLLQDVPGTYWCDSVTLIKRVY